MPTIQSHELRLKIIEDAFAALLNNSTQPKDGESTTVTDDDTLFPIQNDGENVKFIRKADFLTAVIQGFLATSGGDMTGSIKMTQDSSLAFDNRSQNILSLGSLSNVITFNSNGQLYVSLENKTSDPIAYQDWQIETNNTGTRTYTMPDKSGTVAFIDDLNSGIASFVKDNVLAASITNINPSGNQTVDGNSGGGKRVLLAGQTDPTENGIYIINESGAWLRSSDMDSMLKIGGALVYVESGSNNLGKYFLNTDDITGSVGSKNINFKELDLINNESIAFKESFTANSSSTVSRNHGLAYTPNIEDVSFSFSSTGTSDEPYVKVLDITPTQVVFRINNVVNPVTVGYRIFRQ